MGIHFLKKLVRFTSMPKDQVVIVNSDKRENKNIFKTFGQIDNDSWYT